MVAKRKSDFKLATYDDIFSTQEQREENQLAKIKEIPIREICPFPNHPFQVRDDEDMQQLVESIKERGVITPATVRINEEGKYELISGHRRLRASEIAGYETLRCEVVDLSKEEATILMVESNFQRSQILPSEKAHAYKMRLEALSRQGKRTDLTSNPLGGKLDGKETAKIIGEEVGDSQTQVRRYIRLTELVPELMDLVDEGKMKMRPAVEISYLDEESQRDIVEEIDMNESTPSHAQTLKMRKFHEEGRLTTGVIASIMSEEKPNQKEKYTFQAEKLRQYIPETVSPDETAEYVYKALEHYKRFQERNKKRERER